MEKEPILKAFGQRVQELRKERNLSQEQLADLAGVHRTYIGMIERAEKNITLCNVADGRIYFLCTSEANCPDFRIRN